MAIMHPLAEISFITQNEICAIEASAGTGKTWTVERLYIRSLLEKPNLGVNNILVVTFTNNAANELKTRILQQIKNTIKDLIYIRNNVGESSNDPFIEMFLQGRDRKHLDNDVTVLTRAAQTYDQVAIFTIHGFCTRVIKDFQVYCNVSAPIQITTGHSEILLRIIKAFYKEKIIDNSAFKDNLSAVIKNINSLFEVDFDATIIQKILKKLPSDLFVIANGEASLKYTNITRKQLEILSEPIEATVDCIPECFNLPASLRCKSKLTLKDVETINKLRKRELLDALMNNVILYIESKYESFRKLGNKISYDGLVQIVASGVKTNSQFATELFMQYPVAFIDEFQDTDSTQWDIFSSIYNIGQAPRGHVIVVGDPKQAIYRFRGADINTYVDAIEQINNSKSLIENRRSHPNILKFINVLFDQSNQVQYLNFLGEGINYYNVTAKADLDGLTVLPNVEVIQEIAEKAGVKQKFYDGNVQIVGVCGANKPEKEEQLLRVITLEILSLLNANPELKGKIAILVNKNYQATKLVEYLRKYGVKAVELKLGNIYATETAEQLWSILEVIKDISNRSKFNIAISGRIFNFNLNKLSAAELHQEEFELLYQKFYAYKQIFETRGIISLIYKLIEDTSSKEAHGLTNRELSNLIQLGELLNNYSKRLHNPYELLHWFKGKIKAAKDTHHKDLEDDSEEIVRLDNDDEQILITTQHRSKGLEYQILFCPYFSSNDRLDYQHYKLPFFATYKDSDGVLKHELVNNDDLAAKIIEKNNSEIHRVNYVALTRAKSRIYIYLTETTIGKGTLRKYHASSNTSKIDELFGYVKTNPDDNSHRLFNYPDFFKDNGKAIKDDAQAILPGVVAYKRTVSINDLELLKISLPDIQQNKNLIELASFENLNRMVQAYYRQSYSSITTHDSSAENDKEYYVPNQASVSITEQEYKYNVLNMPELRGAKFGLLFHELCETYPLNSANTLPVLRKHNLSDTYLSDYLDMIEEAFSYKLGTTGLSIKEVSDKMHEMEFNLKIKNPIIVAESISKILERHYGSSHPFTLASKELGTIEEGYLKGFIDLFFFADNKFWILDYKTNKVADYSNCDTPEDTNNALLLSMAQNHYYLQYLIYLVAIKRYLEQFINITQATEILGGAIYYYVKGVYVSDKSIAGGVYLDTTCKEVVAELDNLFL